MKISTQQQMLSLTKKINCFGVFDISYLVLDNSGDLSLLSSLDKGYLVDCNHIFSGRFLHFLKMMHKNSSSFYSEKTSLFAKSPLLRHVHYVAFIKKTYSNKIKIYIFHAAKRSEVVHLLLHKEVIKRMALYMDERIVIKNDYGHAACFADLFEMPATISSKKKVGRGYIQEVLAVLLTKKERDLVYIFLDSHAVSLVSEQTGFSRSYVNQLLLSAAHKLGLSRVQDLLSIDKTSGVLLKAGETHVERHC